MSNTTSPRVAYTRLAADAYQGLLAASGHVHNGSLPHELVELVFLRVSQINGCAYCVDMHAGSLRRNGIAARKLDTLPVWQESRFYDPRERAALAWAEALTRLPAGAPAQAAYEQVAAHFDDKGIADLAMAVALINAWNRLGVGLLPPMP